MKKSGLRWLGVGVFAIGLYYFLKAGGVMALYAMTREESIAALGLSEAVAYGILAMIIGGIIYYKGWKR